MFGTKTKSKSKASAQPEITTMEQLNSFIAETGKAQGATEDEIKLIQNCADEMIAFNRETIASFAKRVPTEFNGLREAQARRKANPFASLFS